MISSILLGNLFIYAIRRRKIPGMLPFSFLIMAMLIHSAGYAFELTGGSLDFMYHRVRMEYIGIAAYPFLILWFAREFTDEKRIANRGLLSVIFTFGLTTFILVQTNSFHWFYYSSIGVSIDPGFRVIILEKGPWYYVQLTCLMFSILYSIIVFHIRYIKSQGEYKKKVQFGLLGVSIPLITVLLYTFELGPKYIDIMPFSFLIMALVLFFGVFRHDIFTLTPITYEMIFQTVDEAVFVLDEHDHVLRFNRACREYFPSFAQSKAGELIENIKEWAEYDFVEQPAHYELDDKVYHIKVSRMENNKVRVFVITDITDSEMAKKQLELLATRDGLTGLYNRRYFMEKMEEHKISGTFALLDIDHFKKVNDQHGHFEGDKVLTYFGNQIIKYFKGNLYCRYGGEEFLIFIPDSTMESAFRQLEEMRKEIQMQCKVTFSAGIAVYYGNNIMEVIDRADKKLYEAKQQGRNRICY